MTPDQILDLAADTERLAADVKAGRHGALYAAGEISRILDEIMHALKVGDHAAAAIKADDRARAALRSIDAEIGAASAAMLGRLGGKSRSAKKAAASRANGAKGGRPRKA